MARGFESKDVEFQQAEAERSRSLRPVLDPAERQAQEQKQGLQLALARLRAERAAATHPRHRAMLDQAIEALEDRCRPAL